MDAAQVLRAYQVLAGAAKKHSATAIFGLFSGGHDSLTSTAIAAMHPGFTAAVHINTGIGIEQTREFVRDTCAEQGWPLLELEPDGKTYDELVLERGFPRGPKSHMSMYYWLKQRQIRRVVREHKRPGGRVLLVTGVRHQESHRRMLGVTMRPVYRRRHEVWVNPILDWSATDCRDLMRGLRLPRNEVVDLIHRSGECLCGALAWHKERAEIAYWFPEADQRISELEARVEAAGLSDCRWATWPRSQWDGLDEAVGRMLELCSDCLSR